MARALRRYRRSRRIGKPWRIRGCGRATREDADRLLDFFLLEKALYEIEYELAHRPDWLHVPLAGTWRILSRTEALAT